MLDKTAVNGAFHLFNKAPDNAFGFKILHWLGYCQRLVKPRNLFIEKIQIQSRDPIRKISVLVIKPRNAEPDLPIVIQLHGGGYAIGTPWQDLALVDRLMSASPAIFVVPDFRLSTQAPFPAALNDSVDTVYWAHENAKSLSGDPSRLFVSGQSSGGGLAASACLSLRTDKTIKIAGQMLCYGMLDDRPKNWTELPPTDLTWSVKKNKLAWKMYLGDKSADELSAPARVSDLSSMPPAIGFVGSQDLFRDENIAYFNRLHTAGVKTQFALIEGGYHGVELFAPQSISGLAAWGFFLSAYADMIDK